MDSSTTKGSILSETFPLRFSHVADSRSRPRPSYLADGIFNNGSIFVKNIKTLAHSKEKKFSKAQGAVRKDVERVFGVLMARWQMFESPFKVVVL